MQLGKDINLSELKGNIQKITGVVTISNLTIKNEIGGDYSGDFATTRLVPGASRVMVPTDEIIFAQPSEIYHIRYPERDIRISVKTNSGVTIG
jgi:hypothetical protein